MVAVFVKLNIDRNKKMAKSTRSVRNAIKKRSEEKKRLRRRGLHIDLDKQPTRSIDPKTGRYKMDKQYGKGRDSDQPRKPKAESAAEKKANDKLYKRMQDSRDRDRALYGLPPRPLPGSPGYKKMLLDEEKMAKENKKKAENRKKLQEERRKKDLYD